MPMRPTPTAWRRQTISIVPARDLVVLCWPYLRAQHLQEPIGSAASASGRNSDRKGEVKPRPHSRRYQDVGRCAGTNFDPDWECTATREDAPPHVAATYSVPPGCE